MIPTLFALGLFLQASPDFKVERTEDAVVVKDGGKAVLGYQLRKPADSKLAVDFACYFHPFATPSGAVLTDVAPGDHKHHRGIFLAWFDMHGKKDADFWGWGQFAPVKDRVIVNSSVTENVKQSDVVVLSLGNDWKAEGETLLQEELIVQLSREKGANVLELGYVLHAKADITLPQRAFSGFCFRMRKDGKAAIEGPAGEVKLPAPHHLKPESDWPAQPWYAYQITLPDGAQIGGAVIDDPKNPPALWHNAASIRMLNPCIVAPKDVVIKAGEPLKLHYLVFAWDGAVPRDLLNLYSKKWGK